MSFIFLVCVIHATHMHIQIQIQFREMGPEGKADVGRRSHPWPTTNLQQVRLSLLLTRLTLVLGPVLLHFLLALLQLVNAQLLVPVATLRLLSGLADIVLQPLHFTQQLEVVCLCW